MITVGATDSLDARYINSNFGSDLDLFAQGVLIESDWYSSTTALALASSTAAASAHVAGVAALFLQRNPSATPGTIASVINIRTTQGVVANLGTGPPNKLLFGLALRVKT